MNFSLLWLLLVFPWIFIIFVLGEKWLEFTVSNNDKWWGGFPAWMTGYVLLGVLFFGGPAYLISIICG